MYNMKKSRRVENCVMYERSAIVLERYFNYLFGLQKEKNLSTNYQNYISLVDELEK